MKKICLDGVRAWALIALFCTISTHVMGQYYFPPEAPGMIGNWYTHSLTAQSRNITGREVTVYDDWTQPQYAPGVPDPIYFNCARQFLFATYTAPDDSVDMSINVKDPSLPSVFDVYIYRYSFGGGSLSLVDSFINKNREELFTFASDSQGLYYVDVMRHGANRTTDSIFIRGFLPLVHRVRKLWVEATPICSGTYPSGSYYNFQIKSEPDISTIINRMDNLGVVNATPRPAGSWPAHHSEINCTNPLEVWKMTMEVKVDDNLISSANVVSESTPFGASLFDLCLHYCKSLDLRVPPKQS